MGSRERLFDKLDVESLSDEEVEELRKGSTPFVKADELDDGTTLVVEGFEAATGMIVVTDVRIEGKGTNGTGK